MARWREGNGKTYRERFAEALRYEWKKAKAAQARLDCALGLPLRSCPADAKPRQGAFAGVRLARRLFHFAVGPARWLVRRLIPSITKGG